MLILALGVALLGATGWAAARRWCGSSRLAELVVAAWLLAYAEIVVLTLALGLVEALNRWAMLAALITVLAAVAVAGRRAPRSAPRLRAGVATAWEALHDPLVAAMGAVALLGLGYAAALGIGTPPNDWDSLIYHLPRAALWYQQGRVDYIAGTSDERIDGAAPHAEIGLLFTMVLSHGDRWVTLVQLTSLLALGATIFALARRMGLDVPAALYGAFAFLCLPVLLLQAGTALNDIVVAAFLAASVAFALAPTRSSLVMSALALALAAGTKPTTFLALPAAIVVVLSLRPRKDWLGIGLAWLAGLAAGSYWYYLNLVRTGRLDGGLAEVFQQVPDRQPLAVLLRVYQLSVNLLEMPATAGRGRWAYDVAATCLLVGGMVLLARGGRRRPGLGLAAFGVLVALVPWALYRGAAWFVRPARWALDAVGSHDLADGVSGPLLRGYPTPFYSTFGAVAVVLTVASLPLLTAAVRTRRLPRGSFSLPAAPLLAIVALATAVTFDELRTRFLIFPMALAAVVWGLVRRWRTLAYGVVALAAASTFATLAFASWKPSGVALLFGTGATGTDSGSVWTEPRWRMQGSGRLVDAEANRFVAEHVPRRAATGLVMGRDHSLYAFFNGVDRTIRLVAEGEEAPADVGWLVVSADRRAEVPGFVKRGWRQALKTPTGWTVLRRAEAR